jgi:Zn-dependent protease with chaperone function
MDKDLQIKGIKESEYPTLYAVLKKNMAAYNVTKVKVKIIKHGRNAFAFSLFRNYLMVTEKLLKTMNEEEIEAIIAYEFNHISNRDSIERLIILLIFSIPLIGFIIFLFNVRDSISPSLGILILIFLIISIFIFDRGIKIVNRVSVQQIIWSDKTAILKTKNPDALINALIKIYIEPFIRSKPPSHFEKIRETLEYFKMYFLGGTYSVSIKRLEYLELVKKMLESQQSQNEMVTQKS